MKFFQYWSSFLPNAAPITDNFAVDVDDVRANVDAFIHEKEESFNTMGNILKAIAPPLTPPPPPPSLFSLEWISLPDLPSLPTWECPPLPSVAWEWPSLLLLIGIAVTIWLVARWKRWVVRVPHGKFLVLLNEGNVCRVTDAAIVLRSSNETVHDMASRDISFPLEREIAIDSQRYMFHFVISLRIVNLLHFFHYGHPPEYSLEHCATDMGIHIDALFRHLTEHDLLMIQLNPEEAAKFRTLYVDQLRYYRSVHDRQSATEILDMQYTISPIELNLNDASGDRAEGAPK